MICVFRLFDFLIFIRFLAYHYAGGPLKIFLSIWELTVSHSWLKVTFSYDLKGQLLDTRRGLSALLLNQLPKGYETNKHARDLVLEWNWV